MKQAEFPDRATSRNQQATTIQHIWLEYIEWAKTNKRSWKDDETRYRLHIAHALSKNHMGDIKPAMIQSILTSMVLKKYKPATVGSSSTHTHPLKISYNRNDTLGTPKKINRYKI